MYTSAMAKSERRRFENGKSHYARASKGTGTIYIVENGAHQKYRGITLNKYSLIMNPYNMEGLNNEQLRELEAETERQLERIRKENPGLL